MWMQVRAGAVSVREANIRCACVGEGVQGEETLHGGGVQARATYIQLKVVEGVCSLGACTIVLAVHSQHERRVALYI